MDMKLVGPVLLIVLPSQFSRLVVLLHLQQDFNQFPFSPNADEGPRDYTGESLDGITLASH
ncbi:hypothetical protein D3C76_1811200 [compost metagenome]